MPRLKVPMRRNKTLLVKQHFKATRIHKVRVCYLKCIQVMRTQNTKT
jgi:hypothetical protein